MNGISLQTLRNKMLMNKRWFIVILLLIIMSDYSICKFHFEYLFNEMYFLPVVLIIMPPFEKGGAY